MEKSRFNVVQLLDILALLTFILTFTPIVLPENEAHPDLAGIPYTMWVGFLVSVLFVVLAYVVSIAQNNDLNDQ